MKKITIGSIIFALIFVSSIIPANVNAAKTYRVETGDTLWDISQSYGVPAKIIINQNNISNPSNLYVGQQLDISRDNNMITITFGNKFEQNNHKSYYVNPGDTLWKLAQKFDTSMEKLVKLNDNLDYTYTIYVGQKITVPGNNNNDNNSDNNNNNNNNNDDKEFVYYTVQPGDILWNISQEHDTTVAKIVELNDIHDAYDLYIGRELKVKVKSTEEDETVIPERTREDYLPYYFYKMKKNDRVWKIADRFGVRVSELLRANKIQDINKIQKGTTIIIPLDKSNQFSYIKRVNKQVNNYYRVQNNENITDIADYFNVNVKALRYINNISSDESVRTGQLLLMPVNPALFNKHKLYRVKKNNLPAHELAYQNDLSIRSMLRANYMKDVNTKFKKDTMLILPLDEDSKATWVDYENGEPVNSLFN
jgi:LysM repeat protein